LSHRRARALALVVTFLWSSSWILIRWGLDEETLEPITFAALRYGLAGIALLATALARPISRAELVTLDRSSWQAVALLGLVFYSVTQGAQFVAIDHQPAATSSLVLSLTPLIVAMTATWSLSEMSHPRQIVGAALVAIGAWLYFSGELGATAVGMSAAVIGLGGNVASTLVGRHVNRASEVSPLTITALSMAIGAVVLTAVGVGAEGVPEVTNRGWLIIAWLAGVNTAFAFTLWNGSLRRLTALESAGINNTMLVQIALLAWVYLGELPGTWQWIGIALVSVGVFLTQLASPAPAPEPVESTRAEP
jgi:drug/metabolite transporter (DMT)-like permease